RSPPHRRGPRSDLDHEEEGKKVAVEPREPPAPEIGPQRRPMPAPFAHQHSYLQPPSTPRTMAALRAERICKSFRGLFKRKEVLHQVSLSIEEGEVFGILGPNGAGKTTLMSIFSTLIRSDDGTLEVLGFEALRDTHAVRERINSSSGNPNFPWSLTVRENLNHSGMLYGLYGRDLARSVDEAISSFGLEAHVD